MAGDLDREIVSEERRSGHQRPRSFRLSDSARRDRARDNLKRSIGELNRPNRGAKAASKRAQAELLNTSRSKAPKRRLERALESAHQTLSLTPFGQPCDPGVPAARIAAPHESLLRRGGRYSRSARVSPRGRAGVALCKDQSGSASGSRRPQSVWG